MELVLIGLRRALSGQIQCNWLVKSDANRWSSEVQFPSLHPNSVVPLMRAVLQAAGLPSELYSSHSLRRGFATWATRSGWDLKALMQYVGWRDGQSALRYVESTGVFPGQLSALQHIPSRP